MSAWASGARAARARPGVRAVAASNAETPRRVSLVIGDPFLNPGDTCGPASQRKRSAAVPYLIALGRLGAVDAAAAHQHLAATDMVGMADQALVLHPLDQLGGAVVA